MKNISYYINRAEKYLHTFCTAIDERCVGSQGNREAADYFQKCISELGWENTKQTFNAIDWKENGAVLSVSDSTYSVKVSPYSTGFSGEAELVPVSTIDELRAADITSKIVVLHRDIAKEQLMPKNFAFYNPDSHKEIISILEKKEPAAILCITDRNAALAGGVYPFPLIEDGDFDIPSVYTTEEEGRKITVHAGKSAALTSNSRRIPGTGYNIIASKPGTTKKTIVITAHLDAKKGTPGAIDNATGITILLLLAEILQENPCRYTIEIAALNGEDYYAVPGQMQYIKKNQDRFKDMLLNINIDGAGYMEGDTAVSLFNLPAEISKNIKNSISKNDCITEGPQWPQGDHSIFLQYGVPAIAVTSQWFLENIDSQTITHTPEDNLNIVSYKKTAVAAEAIADIIRSL
jgi:aminopeptidase YwaD